jgi:hypothetical protein
MIVLGSDFASQGWTRIFPMIAGSVESGNRNG